MNLISMHIPKLQDNNILAEVPWEKTFWEKTFWEKTFWEKNFYRGQGTFI